MPFLAPSQQYKQRMISHNYMTYGITIINAFMIGSRHNDAAYRVVQKQVIQFHDVIKY